jgi:hypothetical protein
VEKLLSACVQHSGAAPRTSGCAPGGGFS